MGKNEIELEQEAKNVYFILEFFHFMSHALGVGTHVPHFF